LRQCRRQLDCHITSRSLAPILRSRPDQLLVDRRDAGQRRGDDGKIASNTTMGDFRDVVDAKPQNDDRQKTRFSAWEKPTEMIGSKNQRMNRLRDIEAPSAIPSTAAMTNPVMARVM